MTNVGHARWESLSGREEVDVKEKRKKKEKENGERGGGRKE